VLWIVMLAAVAVLAGFAIRSMMGATSAKSG
jgi:hypothetical protein